VTPAAGVAGGRAGAGGVGGIIRRGIAGAVAAGGGAAGGAAAGGGGATGADATGGGATAGADDAISWNGTIGASKAGAATGTARDTRGGGALTRVGANSSSTAIPMPTVMTPPHTEQRARTPAVGTFAGSTRKTDWHSGHETFTSPP
jgi:hypothetical protein